MDLTRALLLFFSFSLLGWVSYFYGVLREHWFRRKLERETEEATARIVGYRAKTIPNGRHTTRKGPFPILAFPVNGEERQVRSREGLDPEAHPEGSEVRLWFDPYAPEHLHISEDDNELGDGMKRIGRYFILGAAVVSLIVSLFEGWL